MSLDIDKIRADFPALHQTVNGRPLVYLDNGATTHKPQAMIDALVNFYSLDNSNVHRGAHALSDRATEKFEAARQTLAEFINAPESRSVIWTRGSTESINLVAYSWGRQNLSKGDRVLVSMLEHHSNIVPWQLVAQEVGAEVVPIPITDEGIIDLQAYEALLDDRVKMVAFAHVSNALGVIHPVQKMVEMAHRVGAKVLVDGAQGAGHFLADVQQLGCDFYTFSGHKLFGPTGIGALYGKAELLEAMPPWLGGGEMIESVSFAGTTFNKLPFKFEAGTPNIADAIALAASIHYLNGLDKQALIDHEAQLLAYAEEKAKAFEGMRVLGVSHEKVCVLSFVLDGVHSADLGMLLDQQGIAVRTGNHCAQPAMEALGVDGSVRASFSFYNTLSEVDRLFEALEKAREFLI
ncbi:MULTISPECIES: aminotransferase class V-fold PLP-dependent enzyme [Nitrincola]|uniref:Cysteine desulfurase n=1 Tax=Nitrincola nitratireducens TaxID=1229521 RepID=W9VNX2_9GAMM|nr:MULTISPECIES: cysteine desulfurase [Nitrincola]EXJ12180.1 putative cysteine desulfurase [Nitrincola nitratireducens]